MDKDIVSWGILGTGNIAHQFAIGLQSAPGARLVAVGSRSQESAESFGASFQIPQRHASYAALMANAAVDVIYVATPHNLHYENVMACLEAGKHVLCEKPFAVNAAQSAAMFALARRKNLFLMEALWTRFLPITLQAQKLLGEGAIGDLRLFHADFGFRSAWKPQGRLLNPDLAGGSLLDVGIYPLFWACLLFGQPLEIKGVANLGKTAVDESCALVLRFAEDRLATIQGSVRVNLPTAGTVYGTKGNLRLLSPIYRPQGLWLTQTRDPDAGFMGGKVSQSGLKNFLRRSRLLSALVARFYGKIRALAQGDSGRRYPATLQGNGYNYQAIEVMRCLRAGLTESPFMSASATLRLQEVMDELRRQWGLNYPPAVDMRPPAE